VRPLDPRLLRYARATRAYLVVVVVLGAVTAVLVIAQAGLLARLLAGAFADGEGLPALRGPLAALLVVVLARAAVGWVTETSAHRASARAKSQLRAVLLERAAATQAGDPARPDAGSLATLATRGVDALDGYFSRYLPQLVLAVIVPVVVLAVVVGQDWLSALTIALTLPLIPVFMVLIGQATQTRTRRQLHTLQRLAGHFLDVVAGLATLKVFGRAKPQVETIRAVTDAYRRTTMRTLRLAFLSSLVLELLSTISVALVAVSVGLRLVDARLDLRTALFVLVLAPEAYLPLRLVGANFHASADGLAAAEQVIRFAERPVPPTGTRTDVPDPSVVPLAVEGLAVSYPDRAEPALADIDLTVRPGEVVAIVGPSGSGKSTLVGVLLGLVRPTRGRVLVGGVDLAELDPDAWRARVAWVPQRPYLFAASIADNVRLGRPDADDHAVRAAVQAAGLEDVVARVPGGLSGRIGERGVGLSAGERQRVALARAFLRDAPLVVLDEPTANLDGATEAEVLAAVRRLAVGRTVILVAHRPALVELADRVVPLAPAAMAS